MNRKIKYYQMVWLKHDLPAGLSVFLVALPLCLGIALASKAPLYAGLLSGIIGGLIVPLISGSALGVSGPAAGLSTVVAASIITQGNFESFLLVVIVAGLFQLLLGILKLGVVANYFPSSVIKGMLAAIGIILVSKQIPLLLGYGEPDFWTDGFLSLFTGNDFFNHFGDFADNISTGAVIITLVSATVMLVLQHPKAQKLKVIPAPLLVVLMGVLINYIFEVFHSDYVLTSNQLVDIPDQIFSEIHLPDVSSIFSNTSIWKDGMIIGLLATLETLLCVEAVDKLDKYNRITPVNRELVAQGIGNLACGLLGAIPITAVVVRGSANVDAGARTKLAAFTHGLFLLLAVLLVPFALSKIPYASLAAILLVTGFNLTKPRLFKNMWVLGWKQFLPFLITIVVILFSDLLIGVSIGLLLSLYFIIQNNFKAEYKIIKTSHQGIDHYQINLNSNVTFLNKVNLRKALDQIPEYSTITIDGEKCNFIDHDILEIISEFFYKAKNRHIELHLKGIERVNITAQH